MMRSKLIRRNMVLKLDKYRRLIRTVKLIDFYKNQILMVCYCIQLSGFSLKALREYKFRKALLNKTIFFFFKNFNDLYLFYYRIRTFTLSPYFFYPLYLVTPLRRIFISFGLFSKYMHIGSYKYYKNGFIYNLYLNIIKQIFLILLINFKSLIVIKQCQL